MSIGEMLKKGVSSGFKHGIDKLVTQGVDMLLESLQ